MEVHWNSDMAYAFSVHRSVLWMFGSWPLQKNTYFSHIRWFFITVIEFSLVVPAIIDVFTSRATHGLTLEKLLFLECSILALTKNILFRVHRNKLARIMESAMVDWSTVLQEDSSYRVMKKYARIGRLMTLTLFNSIYWCFCLYYLFIVFYPYAQFISPAHGVKIRRNFLVPFSWLADDMSDSVYLMVFLLQMTQSTTVGTRQTVVDSFFFSIVMHLCGQLEVLATKLSNFGKERQTDGEHRKELASLVEKHCHLIEFVKNIEDTFNIIILLLILMNTILIALAGFRLLVSIAAQDNVLIFKSFLTIIFFTFQCLLYSLAGNLLQTCSEQIFFDAYRAPWYKLSPTVSRDLQFIMMRANIPFHVTAGKFVNISCKTIMDILKTAASYISVLSVTLND